jgi:hypothetical protein
VLAGGAREHQLRTGHAMKHREMEVLHVHFAGAVPGQFSFAPSLNSRRLTAEDTYVSKKAKKGTSDTACEPHVRKLKRSRQIEKMRYQGSTN